MKKQTLLLIAAGSMLAFASCNNNATVAGGPSQEQIDSIVNVRVAEMQTTMAAHNDSIINALAQAKADSMMAAMHGTTTTTTTTHSGAKKAAPALAPAKAEPVKTTPGGLKGHSDQNRANNANTVQGGGLKSQSDQNKANNPGAVQGGGLKSHSDQNRNK